MPDPFQLGAASLSAKAQEEAAQTQAATSTYAADLANQQWQITNEQLAPWRNAGTAAINRLSAGTQPGGEFDTFNYSDMYADPGYKWRLQQGIDALNASGAAAGNYGSGNLGVALLNYGQNSASNEYQNAYARWQDQYNRLAGIAGTGQTTILQGGQLGANAMNAVGNNLTNAANAIAQGGVGSANAWVNFANNASNQTMSGIGTYLRWQQQQNLLNQYGGGNDSSWNSWGGYNGGYDGYSGGSYDYSGGDMNAAFIA